MTALAIIQEIDRLPLSDKQVVAQKTLEAIRKEKNRDLEFAANEFYNDYQSDEELTTFTMLDPESFYEAR